MEHIGTFEQKELYPGTNNKYPEASCLPALLKKNNDGSFDYVTEQPVSIGDIIEPCWISKITVMEILQQRPARGDWSNTSYANKNVT